MQPKQLPAKSHQSSLVSEDVVVTVENNDEYVVNKKEPSGFEATWVSDIELKRIEGEKLISFDSKQKSTCLKGGFR
jgi:hypothetical protein